MIPKKRKPHGFTLLEMAVATALLGVTLSAATYIVIGVSSSAERVRRVGDTQETARMALDALAAEIRMSGAAASSGQIGIGTTSGSVARIPAIYSGPNITVTTAGGQQVVTNSIFIVSSEPGAGSPSSDGTGMLGSVVSSAVLSTGIDLQCVNQRGNQVDCSDASFKTNTILPAQSGGGFLPLIVGDYVNAVYMRPTTLGSFAGAGTPQRLGFTEMSVPNAYSPDPKAPFGFARGASIGKARVTHWYVKEVSPGDWELVRSKPILDDKWSIAPGSRCNPASPFVDETNSPGGAVGTVVGSGPIENLQIRFVVDDGITDTPSKFHVLGDGTTGYVLGSCDILADGTPVQKVIREVRISVVARSRMPDHATNGVTHVKRYGLNSWEGVGPAGGALDEYPRRSFEARIVPRNLQGILRL